MAVSLQRAQRFGASRVYVVDDGECLGWVDVHTGTVTVERPDRAREVHEYVSRYYESRPSPEDDEPTPQPDPASEALPRPRTSGHPSEDDDEITDWTSEDDDPTASLPIAEVRRAAGLLPPREVGTPSATDLEATSPLPGAAIRRAAADQAAAAAEEEAIVAARAGTQPPTAPLIDLAGRSPGQGVRARARQEWDAAISQGRTRARIARIFDVQTEERHWRISAEGEELVGRRLDRLEDHGWHVLHSVPVGGSGDEDDIDHLLIGPGGVWAVTTSNRPGARVAVDSRAMWVHGVAVGDPAVGRQGALDASERLSARCGFTVQVVAAIVLVGAHVQVTAWPHDVRVLTRTDVPRFFRDVSPVMSPKVVAEVYAQARLSTTWLP